SGNSTISRVPSFLLGRPRCGNVRSVAGASYTRAHQCLRPARCVFEQVISDMFEIGRSFLGPPKLHLWTALSFGQAPFESCADLFVRQNFPSLNLREPFSTSRRNQSSYSDRKSTRLNSSHQIISYAVF